MFRTLHMTALRAALVLVLTALGLNRRPKTLLLSATASITRQHTSAAVTPSHICVGLPISVRHLLSPTDSI